MLIPDAFKLAQGGASSREYAGAQHSQWRPPREHALHAFTCICPVTGVAAFEADPAAAAPAAPATTPAAACTRGGVRPSRQSAYQHLDVRMGLSERDEHRLIPLPVAASKPTTNLMREGDRGGFGLEHPDCVEALLEPELTLRRGVTGWRRLHAVVLPRSAHLPLRKHVEDKWALPGH
eukprot:CAMPEP_0181177248 /NCGR_PEP_ID=MMETSP1096-20121128/5063_1 /TAXON_ID=156174 ORGANISM="Chrysochromulina ericina, Strain CCMP281" /NCGR_SAMPLE_ID=MMETSP1096 /ASSEMBLY_ACC=CAM_ASM_000453 /LENGTH=177 /DNA_ID=CAMNT_0023265393 /DNA_START=105 /DNA_END=636 /DNA_ORIENTATION=+